MTAMTGEWRHRIMEMIAAGFQTKEILARVPSGIISESTIRRWRRKFAAGEIPVPSPTNEKEGADAVTEPRPNDSVDEVTRDEFEHYFGRFLRPTPHHSRNPVEPPTPRRERKIVVLSCLHVPHTRFDYIDQIIADHQRDTDILILAGDTLDCQSFSRFPKYQHVSIHRELLEGRRLLIQLANAFREIHLLEGNHEFRTKAWFARNIPSEFSFLVRTNILDILVKSTECDNIKLVGREVSGNRTISFLYQIGDAIIAHAQLESKIPMRPAEMLHTRLMNWQDVLGLKEWRVEILCHTHYLGKIFLPPHHVAFEGGCLLKPPEYALEHRFPYTRPQVNGYVVLIQDERGRTQINASNFIFLNWG